MPARARSEAPDDGTRSGYDGGVTPRTGVRRTAARRGGGTPRRSRCRAVSLRTRSQSTCSRSARATGSSRPKSQACSFIAVSFWTSSSVADSTGISTESTSISSASRTASRVAGSPASRWMTSTIAPSVKTLNSQSSGGWTTWNPSVGQPRGGLGGVVVGDHEVDVVVGLRAAARPHGVAADERERDAALLERDGDALERLPQRACCSSDMAEHYPGRPRTNGGRSREGAARMRLATFNILHGRSPADDRVDVDRFAAAIRRWTPTCSRCRRSTATSPGRTTPT